MRALQQNYQILNNTDNDPTHEYFNMGVFNEYSTLNTEPKQLRFNQTKQFSIVDKADDYYLSIVRCNLTSNLPVLVPDIQIKQNDELFTNLTDYELALMYSSESTTSVPNTFGLLGLNGNNYNGELKDGEFGLFKNLSINYPPTNTNYTDYDNYNNGLGTNGNGSVYIINNGVLKVYDKVSVNVIQTFSPPVGYDYKFVCADKSNGNFYVGVASTSTDDIYYKEYQRTGGNVWVAGGTFTSITDKNNVNGICVYGSNLYEFSSSPNLPDTLYGTTAGNVVDNINSNTQVTNGSIMSNYAIIDIFAFAVGIDNKTYVSTYPPVGIENWNLVISSPLIKAGCLWCYNNNQIYAMSNSDYYYYGLQQNCGKGAITNVYSKLGDFPSTLSFINFDSQKSTNKLVAVGSDNNLYISTDPIAPIELSFINLLNNNPTPTIGFADFDYYTGLQSNYLINQYTFPFNGGMFKFGDIYYVAGGSMYTNLVTYSSVDYSIISTITNLDNYIFRLTNFPLGSNYGYVNQTNLIVRDLASSALINTYSFPPAGGQVWAMYDLSPTHFCCVDGTNNLYIYEYTSTAVLATLTLPSGACKDICVSYYDTANGASKLFVAIETIPNIGNLFVKAQEIYEIQFVDTSYTTISQTTLIYNETNPTRQINFIDYHQNTNSLKFMTSQFDNQEYNNLKFNSLFANGGYSLTNELYSIVTIPNFQVGSYAPCKYFTYMSQTTASTKRWTQVPTGGVSIKAVSVSQTDNNNLYCIGSANSRIYLGTLSGGSITLELLDKYTNTYEYLGNAPISGGSSIENIISKWTGAGGAVLASVIDSNQTLTVNPKISSIKADNNHIYVNYNNLNNVIKLSVINPTTCLVSTSVNLNLNILNGLIGFDEQSNLILSTSNLSVPYFTTFDITTLNQVYNSLDPLNDYVTSSQLIFPFNKNVTTTSYNLAGDGCVNLIFIPEVVNTAYDANLLYPKSKEQLFSNPYFYIKYVDTLCRMINNAIAEAFHSIPGASWQYLPYFIWDSVAGKLVYNQPTSTPTGTPAPAGAKWYVAVNQPLFNLLNTFRFKFFPTNSGNGAIYPENIDCRYLLDTNILYNGTTQPSGEFESYVQQVSSVQTWTPVQSLVFISSLLPTEPQMTGIPSNISNNPTTSSAAVAQTNLSKVLTDFIIPLTSGVELTNQIVDFSNSGEYRLVDLIGGQSLNQISLEVYWKDKYGVLHPVYIDAGTNADLLCMLRKKSYNSKF